ncbi:MAG: EAL domain-containing protein [Zoogloea sp.]|nr:EAL domain-containing protein [Zoogloea sp.]
MLDLFKKIVVLAIAYALTGWAALQLAVPPGYTAPIFPPAGIALAALLIFGRRLWPGVLLGAALVEFAAGYQSGISGLAWLGALSATLGATLQAVVGVWLARRLVGLPNPLDTPKSVLRLCGFVAPLSCLISASLNVPELTWVGAFSREDAFFNWWCWWIGDTLGVLIMLPLMFVFFGEPVEAWRRRRLAIALPLLLALGLLAFTFVQVKNWEAQRVQSQFARDAGHIEHLVRKRLEAQLDMMLAMERLMAVSGRVSREDWHDFVTPFFARYPGAQNFGWSPLVRQQDRSRFEALNQRQGRPDFRILARTDSGRTFPAELAPEYLPITYVEPRSTNLQAEGLDLLSFTSLAAGVARARRDGQPAATEAIRLVQEQGSERGVVVYQAVFDERHAGGIAPGMLRGVISGALRMESALHATLEGLSNPNIEVCLADLDGRPGNRRLAGAEECDRPGWLEGRLNSVSPLAFAGRHWQIRLRASTAYIAGLRSWAPWFTLAGGLGVIGLLGSFLLIITGHTRRVEEQVRLRTAELGDANARLNEQLSAVREAEAQVKYLAQYDSLTKLPNRALWLERVRTALNSARRHGDILAVLFLDLDHFKTVNDSLGHPVGDRLLMSVARRLKECLREEDLLARLGGDEFVILLPRLTQAEDSATVAAKILNALSRPFLFSGHELRISVSIGIALFPGDGDDVDALLKHADLAMYGAKESGRNNYQFFVQDMNDRVIERLTLEGDLKRALEQGQFHLYYQPQIDAVSGRCIGCEALVRWRHPERGAVMPDQFIPIAEQTGLIVPLGEWVLAEACRQRSAWGRQGLDFMVSVNLSAIQFNRSDLLERVAAILGEVGCDPRGIELEITESALMQDTRETIERLEQLCALGLRLALDDFGTGYSSLALLKRFPIRRLKLDRSFVMDLPGDLEDAAVTSATLTMARDLGLEVVAEGVETHAQREYLLTRGCNLMQGYLYSRPIPPEAVPAFVRALDPQTAVLL